MRYLKVSLLGFRRLWLSLLLTEQEGLERHAIVYAGKFDIQHMVSRLHGDREQDSMTNKHN